MDSITISHGEWGYVTHLNDFSGGRAAKAGKTPDGRHRLSRLDEHTIAPGVPDKTLDWRTGYGFVRPQDDPPSPDDDLWARWAKCRMRRLDYYVAQMNGSPDPGAVPFFYPERLFVNGTDDNGNQLSRTALLKHLSALRVRGDCDFWHPVQIFTGISMGFPVFQEGLKADTDIGPTWSTATCILDGELPEGYSWEQFKGANYGTLHRE